MKKYYNKALFYQSFYNGKWGILGGSILFFLIMYSSMSGNLNNLKYQISNLEGNSIYLNSSFFVISTFLIILLVYVMITGFNKRNNITFITSGPYTKEEVKRNEFLFLFFTLCLFTLVAAYAIMCVYIRNKDLLPYIFNPWGYSIFILIKIFTLGLAFIVYLSFMDMFFSNLIFTLIALVGFPMAIFFDALVIGQVYFYRVDIYNTTALRTYDVLNSIMNYIGDIISFISYDYTFYRGSRYILFIIIAYLLGSIFVYYLSKFINKKIISGKNFTKKENGAVLMDDELRKKFLTEWQNRKKEVITHPYLREKVEWGMVPYVQAMLLARYLRGDLDEYPVFLWK